MHFPFSFNGVATAIQTVTSSYVGDAGNDLKGALPAKNIFKLARLTTKHHRNYHGRRLVVQSRTELEPWTNSRKFSFSDLANQLGTHQDNLQVEPTYGGDVTMNEITETIDEVSIRFGISPLNSAYDRLKQAPDHVAKDLAMEDEPISDSYEGLNILSVEDDVGVS